MTKGDAASPEILRDADRSRNFAFDPETLSEIDGQATSRRLVSNRGGYHRDLVIETRSATNLFPAFGTDAFTTFHRPGIPFR
jgi:hypothetical protein